MHTLISQISHCWADGQAFVINLAGFPTILCCFSDSLEPRSSGRNRWFIFAAGSCWSCSLTIIDTITLSAITDFLLIIRSLGVSRLLGCWRAYSFFFFSVSNIWGFFKNNLSHFSLFTKMSIGIKRTSISFYPSGEDFLRSSSDSVITRYRRFCVWSASRIPTWNSQNACKLLYVLSSRKSCANNMWGQTKTIVKDKITWKTRFLLQIVRSNRTNFKMKTWHLAQQIFTTKH